MLNNVIRYIALLICFLVISCSKESEIHAYVVIKSDPEYMEINDMRPLIRVSYRIKDGQVISELAGLVEEYKQCKIVNLENWKCQYTDGTGLNQFGFTNGKYWKNPITDESIKYVGRWEYNIIRCKWYLYYNGKLKGLSLCVKTYI